MNRKKKMNEKKREIYRSDIFFKAEEVSHEVISIIAFNSNRRTVKLFFTYIQLV